MSYEVMTTEKWIAESYIFCKTDNSFNIKGEQSTRFLIDNEGKFCFDSEGEAKEALEKYLTKQGKEQYPERIFEIKKVYIIA